MYTLFNSLGLWDFVSVKVQIGVFWFKDRVLELIYVALDDFKFGYGIEIKLKHS